MPEEGEEMPAPDEAFAQVAESQGLVEDFCEENYPDHQDQCQVMIADRLRGGDNGGGGGEPQPEPEPEQESGGDVIDGLIGGDPGDQGVETLVADCMGRGFLGLHRPDTKACMRVVAKHEREKRR